MRSRVFLFLLIPLVGLVVLTSPPILGSLWPPEATPTPTATPPATATWTATRDPFADVPMATPLGSGAVLPISLPTPVLGALPPTSTPAATQPLTGLLPDTLATPGPVSPSHSISIPPAPTPSGAPPTRLIIPRLALDAPVEAVGMIPSNVAAGIVEWDVPDHRAAGWLDTSAPFGLAGNTVLDGHHNIKGEVFRDLWTLQAGDKITLLADEQARSYVVEKVLILPEKNQPLAVRLANAGYIQPTADERLTLITCWPYENNTHRTVVIAKPVEVNHS